MPEWLLQVIGMLAGGVAVYAGIRADLAATKERAKNAHESAERAHIRIDGLMLRE